MKKDQEGARKRSRSTVTSRRLVEEEFWLGRASTSEAVKTHMLLENILDSSDLFRLHSEIVSAYLVVDGSGLTRIPRF